MTLGQATIKCCKDCTTRCIGCHSVCKEYIAEKRREISKKTSLIKAIEKIKEEPIISVPNQERQLLWPQAISLISREPLGLGFGYGYTSKAIKSSKIGDDFATSHNTFLQVALESGWLGFIIFLSGLYYLYKILKTLDLHPDG